MACRGVHFATEKSLFEKLLAAKSDETVLEIVQEEIEEKWYEDWLQETDKAWDAIHRCLTDGKLEYNNGVIPLNTVILGGTQLYKADDYIISAVSPEQVVEVASALQDIDKTMLKLGYEQIEQNSYDGELGEEDFEYTWSWFKNLPALFYKAANSGRAVIFSVDQ